MGSKKTDEMRFWTKDEYKLFSRAIAVPRFLTGELKDHLIANPGIGPDDRLFPVTKCHLKNEMARGCRISGVKEIRIYDLRHSHVSLLIEMGFSALAIAERLGYEIMEATMMYARLLPSKQEEMAEQLDGERGPLGVFELDEIKPMEEAKGAR